MLRSLSDNRAITQSLYSLRTPFAEPRAMVLKPFKNWTKAILLRLERMIL